MGNSEEENGMNQLAGGERSGDTERKSTEETSDKSESGSEINGDQTNEIDNEDYVENNEDGETAETTGSLEEDDDEDDDYLLSDENEMDESHERMGYNATLADHSEYLLGTLNHALDSLELDKSLVIQAQLSGVLNNENQKITEKRLQVLEKIELLKGLFKKNFDPKYNPETNGKVSVIGQLSHDIQSLEKRIDGLKNGHQTSSFSSLFKGSQKVNGVINRFPVEYNQARDKILERQIEEE